MIKQIFTGFLLIAFVIRIFSGVFIRLDYYLNIPVYANNCENKTKPKLKCSGKCQMMKKLAAEEKKEEQLPERKFDNKTEVLSSKSFFCTTVPEAAAENTNLFLHNAGAVTDIAYSVFHPPQRYNS